MSYNTKPAQAKSHARERISQSLKVTREHQLEYLGDMLEQMRDMAHSLEQPTLAFVLEMAMMEARMQFEIERFHTEV